jgi:osmotically inducible protein OsmC
MEAALIDDLSAKAFEEIVEGAKANCSVSKALSVPI